MWCLEDVLCGLSFLRSIDILCPGGSVSSSNDYALRKMQENFCQLKCEMKMR